MQVAMQWGLYFGSGEKTKSDFKEAATSPRDDRSLQEYNQRYREYLHQLEEKMQANYDKSILTLSSGAIAISFAFIKDVCGGSTKSHEYLLAAWTMWSLSILCVIVSFHLSVRALQYAVRKFDDSTNETEWNNDIDSIFNKSTSVINVMSGCFFLSGIGFLIWFVRCNLP